MKHQIILLIFCIWVSTGYWYEYSYGDVDYALRIDFISHEITLLRPVKRVLDLPKSIVKNLINKADKFGYSTCMTYCAGGAPDLPKGSYYSNCWTIDEYGVEQRILEQI